jgi:TRAP-type C4-dicarboxylate transport system permease small subunit
MDGEKLIEIDGPAWPRAVANVLSYLAAGLIFALMALTFADVVARYIVNSPIPGAFEVVGFILGIAVFTAIAVVSFRNEHITVSMFDHLFRGRVRWCQQAFVIFVSAVATGFIAYRMFASAEKMRETRQLALMFNVQIAPIVYTMALMAAIACLLISALLVHHLRFPNATTDVASASLD